MIESCQHVRRLPRGRAIHIVREVDNGTAVMFCHQRVPANRLEPVAVEEGTPVCHKCVSRQLVQGKPNRFERPIEFIPK